MSMPIPTLYYLLRYWKNMFRKKSVETIVGNDRFVKVVKGFEGSMFI